MTRRGVAGQVVVEMLLILPVFLTVVFSIMEIGYLSFQLIVLNHATYEVARIGGMTFTSPPGHTCGKLEEFMRQILPTARVACGIEDTLGDKQVQDMGISHMNRDLIVTGTLDAQLLFPFSSVILANAGPGKRRLTAVMRMPIEKPIPR